MDKVEFTRPTLAMMCAPTCAGKTHLLNLWVDMGLFTRIVSTTTRPPRSGEKDGVDYHFISEDESAATALEDGYAEYIAFGKHRYGVTREELKRGIDSGKPPIVIVEPHGLHQYIISTCEMGIDYFTIFVDTPEEERGHRLIKRTSMDICQDVLELFSTYENVDGFGNSWMNRFTNHVARHTDRVRSMITKERDWFLTTKWHSIVPGTDMAMATGVLYHDVWKYNEKRKS